MAKYELRRIINFRFVSYRMHTYMTKRTANTIYFHFQRGRHIKRKIAGWQETCDYSSNWRWKRKWFFLCWRTNSPWSVPSWSSFEWRRVMAPKTISKVSTIYIWRVLWKLGHKKFFFLQTALASIETKYCPAQLSNLSLIILVNNLPDAFKKGYTL